jgi:hypothetical protein
MSGIIAAIIVLVFMAASLIVGFILDLRFRKGGKECE